MSCEFCENDYYAVVCYLPMENGDAVDLPQNYCQNCGELLSEPAPLTLERLREMEHGCNPIKEHKWIWFHSLYEHENAYDNPSGYMIILPHMDLSDGVVFSFGTSLHGVTMSGHEREYGKTWLVYDRPPKEQNA